MFKAISLIPYFRFLILIHSLSLFCSIESYSQHEDLYSEAYRYIYKSKELAQFRNAIRTERGIIAKRINVSDSVFKNNPYLFLCSILFKKNNNNDNCTKLIGADRLKVYDSINQEYIGYIYSEKVNIPFRDRSLKGKKAFTLSFSDVFKNTIVAEVHFQNGKILDGQSGRSILFLFCVLCK